MISYLEFLREVKENLHEYLPEEYRGAEIEVFRTEKYLSNSYDGISITPKGANMGICLDLTPVYRNLDDPAELPAALSLVAVDVMAAMEERPEHLDRISEDFDFFRKHLIVQLVNGSRYEEELRHLPHRSYGEIVMVYRLFLPQKDGNVLSAVVNHSLMEGYGLKENELHELSLMNAPVICPMTIRPLGEEETRREEQVLFLAKSRFIQKGAGCMFYPEFLADAAGVVGSNFFVLPFSVESILLVRDTGDVSIEFMRDMAFKLSTYATHPEDRLSKEVYYCDLALGRMVRADEDPRFMRAIKRSSAPPETIAKASGCVS